MIVLLIVNDITKIGKKVFDMEYDLGVMEEIFVLLVLLR